MLVLRQGDVLLVESDLPLDPRSEIIQDGPVVLAHGEVTGHKHAIYEPEKVRRFEVSGMTYLQILESAKVEHEEHAPVTLLPKQYQVVIQTEYRPEGLRNVED